MSVLAIVPARGGSRGIPRKNLVQAAGKPLIEWTIESARQSTSIDRLILSSDDKEIQQFCAGLGCEVPFTRPAELATDTASAEDVVMHALRELPGFDFVLLLQPTSPLRSTVDIDQALALAMQHRAPVVSVCATEKHPAWTFFVEEDQSLSPVSPQLNFASRRQDLRPAFSLNGAIYISPVDQYYNARSFLTENTRAFPMPRERSLDIDSTDDLLYMEFWHNNRRT